MTRLDGSLLKEALPALAVGALLYTSLAVSAAVVPRLELVAGAPFPEVFVWILAHVPSALVETLPITLVLAVLLTYGRMEQDHELVAFRAGGVSLARIAAPLLALALASTAASLVLQQTVTPRTTQHVASGYWDLAAQGNRLFRLAGGSLPVGTLGLTYDRSLGGSATVLDVEVTSWSGDVLTFVRAREGRFDGADLVLTGYRAQRFDFAALADQAASDVPLEDVILLDSRGATPESTLRLTLGTTEEELLERFGRSDFADARSLTELWRDARLEGDSDDGRAARLTLQRRLAQPWANIALLLLAVPLAVGGTRGRGVAFGLALAVSMIWYLLTSVGLFAAQTGLLPIPVGVWLGNGLTVAAAAVLWRRAIMRS